MTTFFLNSEIDTGDLLFQEHMTIGPDDTAGDVHDRMMELGAQTVLKTVQAIENQNYTLQKQDESQVSKAPKIFHETNLKTRQGLEPVIAFLIERGML